MDNKYNKRKLLNRVSPNANCLIPMRMRTIGEIFNRRFLS